MKLFVTVGAQMPFDRLVGAMDAWAGAHPEHRVQAQVGESKMATHHLRCSAFLSPPAFAEACDAADIIVGHAGTGTLFAALERGTAVVVLPRHAQRGETRNDHQIATARRFEGRAGVAVAWTEEELGDAIEGMQGELDAGVEPLAPPGSDAPLLRAIAAFIDQS